MAKTAKNHHPLAEKACTRCLGVKLASEFFKDVRLRSGLSSKCKACNKAMNYDWRERNPEKWAASYTAWRQENPERVKQKSRENYQRTDGAARGRARYWANRDVERERNRQWAKENRAHLSAACAAYFAARDQRTPPWADLDAISAVYAQAAGLRDLGFDVHVDHVVPLRGRSVSGLHVVENLQILSAVENIAKGNRFDSASDTLVASATLRPPT